jgi:cation transport regulator
MMYAKTSDLPETIRDVLPKRAQELYMRVYNEGLEIEIPESAELLPESLAHQLAWDAVMREFVRDTATGHWRHKDEAPTLEVETHNGLWRRLRARFQPTGA